MPARIRSAELEDAAAIARVHVRTWQQAYRGQLPDAFLDALDGQLEQRVTRWREQIRTAREDHRHVLVAVHEGEVVGFVSFGPAAGEASASRPGEIYAIYVDAAHLGHGDGQALLAAASRGLRGAGFTEAVLWVLDSNERARRFYEAAGWRADGGVKTEHGGAVVLREVRYRGPLRAAAPPSGAASG